MKLINPNHIVSKNFEFFRKDKDSIIYTEGENYVRIQVEAGYDPEYYTAIYLSIVKEWTVPKGKGLDECKKNRIAKNIKKGFQFMNTRVKIE